MREINRWGDRLCFAALLLALGCGSDGKSEQQNGGDAGGGADGQDGQPGDGTDGQPGDGSSDGQGGDGDGGPNDGTDGTVVDDGGSQTATCTPGVQAIALDYETSNASNDANLEHTSYDGSIAGVAAHVSSTMAMQLQLSNGQSTAPCTGLTVVLTGDAPETGKVYEAGTAGTNNLVATFSEGDGCVLDVAKLKTWAGSKLKVTIDKLEGEDFEATVEGSFAPQNAAAKGSFDLSATVSTPCFVSQ